MEIIKERFLEFVVLVFGLVCLVYEVSI